MNTLIDSVSSNGAAPQTNSADDGSSPVDATTPIGLVTSPPRLESTSEECHFWVRKNHLVEKTQIVRTTSEISGMEYTFYGVVDEVKRVSRQRDVAEAFDRHDGSTDGDPALKTEGVTYASVKILRSDPEVLTPPIEDSAVFLGGECDASFAYGFDEMADPLAIGLLRNGGSSFAGLAQIDLDFLLGGCGGHLNITGMTGVGTKTSFLLTIVKALLHKAESGAPHIVPIILNVKGEDLMWINKPSNEFSSDDDSDWQTLDIPAEPFCGTQFFASAMVGNPSAHGVDGCPATPYSWALRDVLFHRLFSYLFDDRDMSDRTSALAADLVAHLTHQPENRMLREELNITNWQQLLEWVKAQCALPDASRDIKMHAPGTWHALYRRLWEILSEGGGLFPREAVSGAPLNLARTQTSPPLVVDIHSLPGNLQRFVVAAVVRQVVDERCKPTAPPGLRYLIVLDELNRFAPRDGKDGITKLLKEVALERRSAGVILFGAQQFASQVAPEIVESASVRALGRCGPGELDDRLWKSWDATLKRQAGNLKREEKLISLPSFRQPMLVKLPRPCWAMRREQIAPQTTLPELQEMGF